MPSGAGAFCDTVPERSTPAVKCRPSDERCLDETCSTLRLLLCCSLLAVRCTAGRLGRGDLPRPLAANSKQPQQQHVECARVFLYSFACVFVLRCPVVHHHETRRPNLPSSPQPRPLVHRWLGHKERSWGHQATNAPPLPSHVLAFTSSVQDTRNLFRQEKPAQKNNVSLTLQ
jgi:hypothetical protein